ncbi:hypothetical protein Tco_0631163, partial [Tanacetum coccineum]
PQLKHEHSDMVNIVGKEKRDKHQSGVGSDMVNIIGREYPITTISKATLVVAANTLSCCPAKMWLDFNLLQLQNNARVDVKCKYETRNTGNGPKNKGNTDSYETLRHNIIDGINIDDLTIEQYLRLTQENQTPSMVKKVDDMTIAEYIEYKKRMKRQYSRNSGSYFPTYSGHCTSSNNTTIEFPRNTYFNPIQPNTEFNYDFEDMELDEEAGYTTDEKSVVSEHEAIDLAHTVNTQSFEEELSSGEDLDEWLKAKMEKHMSKQNEKNEEDALIAIIKSIREDYRDVYKNKQISASEGTDLKNLLIPWKTLSIMTALQLANLGGATMPVKMDDMTQQETLGTVKNILVKIDKFEFPCDFEEISLGIGEDKIKFDVNGNPLQSNVTIKKIDIENTSQEEESFNPLEIGYDLFSYESPACFQFEHDTRNYDTIDLQNEIARQINPLLDKGGLTKRWHICKPVQVFYDDGSGEDCGMWPTCDPDSSFCYGYKEHSEIGEKANISESPKLRPFRPRPCDYSFDEWLKVKIWHTNIYDSDREIVFNEWILDSFDVEEEYAKEIGNPYSQKFDEYKQVFDNEVEHLSNEYTLRIGKRGMFWMMFGRNASTNIEKLSILGTMKDSKKMSYGKVEMKN